MRVGIVGLGARITNVARMLLGAKPDMELVAYADPSPAGLDALQTATGATLKGYGDLAAMLGAEKLDLLMIGSPNFLHIEHLEGGLRSDVPRIFCEKPVVISEAETFRLLELLRDNGGHQRVVVGLVLRYAPLFRAVQQARNDGTLGDVVSIEASEHIAPYHAQFFHRDWRRHAARSGGFMLEKCCHDLDLYNDLAGGRPMRIASFGGRKSFVPGNKPPAGHRFPAPDLTGHVSPFEPRWGGSSDDAFTSDSDLVDCQTALVEYDNGVNLCFHTNHNVPDEFRRFAVIGTRGMAEGDFNRNFLRIHDARSGDCLIDRDDLDRAGASHSLSDETMARDLAAHFDHDAPLPVTVLDALVAGLTAIKMDEARVSGTVVDLAPTWQRFDSYGLG